MIMPEHAGCGHPPVAAMYLMSTEAVPGGHAPTGFLLFIQCCDLRDHAGQPNRAPCASTAAQRALEHIPRRGQ
jgi:hypothetical protein